MDVDQTVTEGVAIEGSQPDIGVSQPEAPPTEAPAQDAAPVEPEAPPAPVKSKYEERLEKLMSQARDNRRQQQETEQQRRSMEYARRIQEAAQYGPDAVLKAAGVEQPKMDLSAILGEEDDGTPPTVKELKRKVADLEKFIQGEQKSAQQRSQQEQQQRMSHWEQNEIGRIEEFIDTNKEKYQFVAQLKNLGSQRDIYSGIINMYQEGLTPSYDDVADLVESRVEDILTELSRAPKFGEIVSKLLGEKQTAKVKSAPTLTGALRADSAVSAPKENETDEENRQSALQAAYAAREAALKQIKASEAA